MRVRFAPSPTGPLHIGGVRTALYNYLLARKNGGAFVLRIEDTDQTRYVKGAEQYIIEALQWAGIAPDEGPGIGGDYGPYRQSERKARYAEYAEKLVASGHAYYAFDTESELEQLREEAMRTNTMRLVRTQGKNSLTLSEEEANKRRVAGQNVVVRFLAPTDETIIVNDLIKGEVRFDSNTLDDKVLLKADGMPTYHLANIVDDHQMAISHVIRGEEWLPSTALHVLLYRSLGWQPPQFAHLPLILKPAPTAFLNKKNIAAFAEKFANEYVQKNTDEPNPQKVKALTENYLRDYKNLSDSLNVRDKDTHLQKDIKGFLKGALFGKLSKRDGARLGFPVFPMAWKGDRPATSFNGFKEAGFEPWAMLNFLAFLGWNPGTEQEIFSKQALIDAFSIERISKSGARFDYEKAKWYNQQYMLAMSEADMVTRLQPLLTAKGYTADDAYLQNFVKLMRERVTFFKDMLEDGYYFFEPVRSYDEQTVKKRWKSENRSILEKLQQTISNIENFEAETIEKTVKGFVKEHELSFGQVFPFLRIAFSGSMQGPDLFQMMALLGKTECLERLEKGVQAFEEIVSDM